MTRITSGKLGVDVTATNPLYADATLPTVGPQQNLDLVLGDCVNGEDGTEFQFCQASGGITQFDWVGIDENNQAASLTKAMADDGFKIGVAQVTAVDNDGIWIATEGRNLNGNVLASVAADVPLYTSATAGHLDDTSASQTKIDGVVAVAANATASATNVECLLTFPKSVTF